MFHTELMFSTTGVVLVSFNLDLIWRSRVWYGNTHSVWSAIVKINGGPN